MTTLTSSQQGGLSNTPPNSHSLTAQTCPIDGLAVHIDWISGTGKIPKIQPLLDFIRPACNEWSIVENYQTLGDYHFTHIAKCPAGIRVKFFQDDDGFYQYHLEIPGSPLTAMPLLVQLRICRGLQHAYKLRCTRIDVALDDYRREISWRKVNDALLAGNFAGFKVFDPLPGRGCRVNGEIVQQFPTHYLGSKSSDKYVCMYDALATHPDIDAIRWELRYRHDYARDFFNLMCHESHFWNVPQGTETSEEDRAFAFGQMLAEFVVGAIDFVKRKDKNLSRATRLRWWERFIQRVGSAAKITITRPAPSIDRRLSWLYKQVANTLAILKQGWGTGQYHRYLAYLTDMATSRLRAEDLALIATLQNGG